MLKLKNWPGKRHQAFSSTNFTNQSTQSDHILIGTKESSSINSASTSSTKPLASSNVTRISPYKPLKRQLSKQVRTVNLTNKHHNFYLDLKLVQFSLVIF